MHTQVHLQISVRYRDQIGDNHALNALDRAGKEHDYIYLKEQEEYAKDHNRMKHLNNIWKADDKFIQQSSTQQDDPIVGKLASVLSLQKGPGWWYGSSLKVPFE